MTVLNPPQPGDSRNVINYADYLQQLKAKPARKKRNEEEFRLCCALKRLLDRMAANGELNAIYLHIPNGGSKLTASQGGRLKAMGLLAGAADYLFVHNSRAYFVEMKAPNGTQQESQKEFEALCNGQRAPYAICRSTDEVLAMLTEWGILQ